MNYLEKLYHKELFKLHCGFSLDLAASVIASLFAIFLVKPFFFPSGINANIVICWILGSFVFSWLFFTAFKIQKAIIRQLNIALNEQNHSCCVMQVCGSSCTIICSTFNRVISQNMGCINIGFASLICITGGYANYNDCCIQLCSGTIWQKKDWRENLHLRNR